MPETDVTRCYFSKARIEAMEERTHVHQYNENAVRLTRTLGDLAGLEDMGLHMVRIEPGRETTEHHYHGQDEEFLIILSGRGEAHIGDEKLEVAPGDVMMFPKGGPAHSMRNPFQDDLVYLMGGTRPPVDICTYPRLGRTQIRANGEKQYVDAPHLKKV